MFRSIDRSPRRRNRAVTLIEAVLYISIALALIVGGLVFFQQASTAAKTSTMVRQLSATLAEARVLVQGLPVGGPPLSITPLLISAGAVPPDMVESPMDLVNPFGGFTEVVFWDLGGGNTALYIVATNVPKAVCAKLLTATSGSGSASGSGGASGTTALSATPLSWGDQMVSVELTNIPKGVCARLLTASSGSGFAFGTGGAGFTTLVSSGTMFTGARASTAPTGTVRNFAMNATQAGWMCKYGAIAYSS